MAEAIKDTLKIVVLDGRRDRYASQVTAAIAEALTVVDESDDEGDGSRQSVPPASAEPASEDAFLHDADAAVVMDPGSLVRAHEAGVPVCVAVLPGFDVAWGGDLQEADAVVVAHEAMKEGVVRRGVPAASIYVAGPVAPAGYERAVDRAALRKEVGVTHDGSLVLVPAAVLEEFGPESILVQLSLVNGPVGFVFHVGTDPDVADALRRGAPAHGLTAWMFADERGAVRYWQVCDLVLGRTRGYEVARALAVGAPLALLPPGRTDLLAADALEGAGVAVDADVLATFAVILEQALDPDALAQARKSIEALGVDEAGKKVSECVYEAWRRRHRDSSGRVRGLPHGLEALAKEPVAPSRRPSLPPSGMQDLEARVERELEELKKRL